MQRVTYLLGAGASCQTLPLVSDIPNRLMKLINDLSSYKFDFNSNTLPLLPKGDIDLRLESKKVLKDSLNWLLENSSRHASIDTFAKKLWLTGKQEELRKLKATLSFFFIYEQAINNPDKRYDTFFASILGQSLVFPKNIKILSWNYDNQFEMAYSQFFGNNNLYKNSTQLRINVKGWINFYRGDFFTIHKLNGTTGFHDSLGVNNKHFISEIPFDEPDIKFLERLVGAFEYDLLIKKNNKVQTLSFAWEQNLGITMNRDFITKVSEDVKNTQILVIIGYSFPFFNREVDRQILNEMDALKKVYIQDKFPNIVKDSFLATIDEFDKNYIIPIDISDTQFYLPKEL